MLRIVVAPSPRARLLKMYLNISLSIFTKICVLLGFCQQGIPIMAIKPPRSAAPVRRTSDANHSAVVQHYSELIKREMVGFALCNLVLWAVGALGLQYLFLAALFLPGSLAAVGGQWILKTVGKRQPGAVGQLLSFVTTTFTVLSLAYVAFVAINGFFGAHTFLLQSVEPH